MRQERETGEPLPEEATASQQMDDEGMPRPKEDIAMFAQPTVVYTFRCSANWKRRAATIDKKGANLPRDFCTGGQWMFLESHRVSNTDGPSEAVDIDEMRTALASRGWYVWDGTIGKEAPPGRKRA